jgi:hypothetical protein
MSTAFRNAFYIKLGRAGCWEEDSIRSGKLRLGWTNQSLADINAGHWDTIEAQLRQEQPGSRQVATTDLHRLRDIVESSEDDIWITFHAAKLWWARLANGPVQADHISKFRLTTDGWHDTSASGRLLVTNDLPGKLAMLQGFRGTVCRVAHGALLARVLAGTRSSLASAIAGQREQLSTHLASAIRELHWKDYETLVDLVFRHAGWERVSVLGQHAKAYDLELREPLTGTRYVVQVKSQAGLADAKAAAAQFSPNDYRKVFFVVHSPDRDLLGCTSLPSHVELVEPARLAQLALDAGLTQWLEDKVA